MTTAAIRQHRRRERVKRGAMVIPVEVTFDDADALIEAGWLGAWDDRNPVAIAAALRLAAGLRHA